MKGDKARFKNVEINPEKIKVYLKDDTVIEGTLHLKVNNRIVDQLNDPKNHFIVLTDVQITNSKETDKVLFIILNHDIINYCISID